MMRIARRNEYLLLDDHPGDEDHNRGDGADSDDVKYTDVKVQRPS